MAANPAKGETDIVIEGVTYTLVMSFNGLLDVQSLFAVNGVKPKVTEILQRVANQDLEAYRAVFWGALRRHHPDITLLQAGELMSAAGGIMALDALLADLGQASAPDDADIAAMEAVTGRPSKAAPRRAAATRNRGTGAKSR